MKGQLGQDCQDRTASTGLLDMTAFTGLQGQDFKDRTVRKGQLGQDCPDRIAKTGLLRQDFRDRTAGPGLLG
jgi:hypothetical protein